MKIIEFNKTKFTPKVSIVCLTFNAQNFISELITSFFSQEMIEHCEIVIGDDASGDDTVALLTELLMQSPCAAKLIVREQNVGPAQNWLDAIGQAKSPLIAYVDGDDYFLSPRKLVTDIAFFKDDTSIRMLFGPARKEINGMLTEEIRNEYESWDVKTIDIDWVLSKGGGFYPTSAVVFRREILNDLPEWFFTTHSTGDLPLAIAALLNNGKIAYKKSVDVVYRVHRNSRTNSTRSFFVTFKNNSKKKQQNCDFYDLLLEEGLIDNAMNQELSSKEDYIFFSKLLDIGIFHYCVKKSIFILPPRYLIRLYAKIAYLLFRSVMVHSKRMLLTIRPPSS